MTNSNKTMWYCLTICEKTGNLMSNGQPSVISFHDFYWNQSKIVLQSDGITAAKLVDNDGNESTDINGLVKIYCFSGGSTNQTSPSGYSISSPTNAYSLFPNWTSNHTMNNLVFALIKVDYNKEKNITGLGTMEFKIKNTMKQPGDVLYDYMTNTRYGAGIAPEEINSNG
jgi:hypothetical protein